MLATPSIMPGAFLMIEGPYFWAPLAAPLASPPSMDPQPRSCYYLLEAALAIPPMTEGRRPARRPKIISCSLGFICFMASWRPLNPNPPPNPPMFPPAENPQSCSSCLADLTMELTPPRIPGRAESPAPRREPMKSSYC